MLFIAIIYSFFISTIFASINDDAVNEFGSFLGINAQTPAYHNGASMDDLENFICIDHQGQTIQCPITSVCKIHQQIFTGWKWQCVEYARRWLIQNKGITFDPVDFAYMIWELEHAKTVTTQQKIPINRFKNDEATIKPEIGDLVIYDVTYAEITGHVAVIVGVDQGHIHVAEQNVSGQIWKGPYSRTLPFYEKIISKHQSVYGILERGLIGWLRMCI
ncbi:MAG: hypothetical protein NEHIOOID_00916 [Holosporales bacterium]